MDLGASVIESYAGIDLHSSNNYTGVIDEEDRRLYGKRLPNHLPDILKALDPFKESLESVVVESTYNWYWLVDGLQDAGYEVHVANPSAIKQYEGLKHTDDKKRGHPFCYSVLCEFCHEPDPTVLAARFQFQDFQAFP